jgi:hypothetical protein
MAKIRENNARDHKIKTGSEIASGKVDKVAEYKRTAKEI